METEIYITDLLIRTSFMVMATDKNDTKAEKALAYAVDLWSLTKNMYFL